MALDLIGRQVGSSEQVAKRANPVGWSSNTCGHVGLAPVAAGLSPAMCTGSVHAPAIGPGLRLQQARLGVGLGP